MDLPVFPGSNEKYRAIDYTSWSMYNNSLVISNYPYYSTSTGYVSQTFDHSANKWEGQPLTSIDDGDEGALTEQSPSKEHEVESKEDEEAWYKSPKKFIKVMLPHVALLVILLSYTSLGAVILQVLETDVELTMRREKLEEILTVYEQIANHTWQLRDNYDVTREEWSRELYTRLAHLSRTHEGGPISLNVSDIHTKWTFPSAVLYILTILTTCGYDHVGPQTDIGKVFSVAFALVGIPLMFITAADIGKFLSEMMMRSIRRVVIIYTFTRKHCRRIAKCCCGIEPSDESEERKQKEDVVDEEDDVRAMFGEDPDDVEYHSLWFPIGAYIGLICFYCAVGGLMYTQYEDGWGFIKAFHFSFNTITTVGLGNIDVTDWLYLVLNVAYVIIGLAVVTMCVDLASTHLKAYFTRIHYFGRGLPFGMSGEIREMMAVIAAMRKKKGGKVTWSDMKDYLDKGRRGIGLRPFIPRNIHLWRFVDESSSAVSTARQDSVASDLLCSSTSSTRRASNLHTTSELSVGLTPASTFVDDRTPNGKQPTNKHLTASVSLLR